MKKTLLIAAIAAITSSATAQDYPESFASYSDFKNLVEAVEGHRAERLIDFNTFLKMSEEDDVVILDTRSTEMYNAKHIKGAIHLDFTDFTQENLRQLIPNPHTKILIYCNNNFEGDQMFFATKAASPADFESASTDDGMDEKKPVMLALNIPTYINLYGYGYRNVYELRELISVSDPRVTFEGTAVQ